jgi:aryl-alcohol dehydrogenase-like predicted oxidoreductase
MEMRKLGRSDLRVSALGIGCWSFGGGAYWGNQRQEDVDQVVHQAIDRGVNFFDTAEAYNDGASESSLGIALKGRRDRAVVCTKVAPANASPAVLRRHCEESLRRLQTDYVDLYMMHWPITPHAIEHFTKDRGLIDAPPSIVEAFTTMEALKREGKIRAIGVSNHGVKQLHDVLDVTEAIAADELAYSLVSRAIEAEIMPLCAAKDIGIVAYMPLQQGLLTGRFRTAAEIGPMQARSRHFHRSRGTGSRHGEDGAEKEIFAALAEIQIIAAAKGIDMSTLALAWAVARREITTTIVGCRNPAQLERNIAGAVYPIDRALFDRLAELTDPVLARLGNNPDYYESRGSSRIE